MTNDIKEELMNYLESISNYQANLSSESMRKMIVENILRIIQEQTKIK